MIIVNIDFKKIQKERLKRVTLKDGSEAAFGDIVLVPYKAGRNQRGEDGFCKMGQTKEEREARTELPIIGNWKDTANNKGNSERDW